MALLLLMLMLMLAVEGGFGGWVYISWLEDVAAHDYDFFGAEECFWVFCGGQCHVG